MKTFRVHSQAAAETGAADIIGHLQWFGGRLYAGYGDSNANSGPTTYKGLDPATDTWNTGTSLATEEISMSRAWSAVGRSTQFVPYENPDNPTYGDYAFGVSRFTQDDGLAGGAHVYDIVRGSGTTVWACGMDTDEDASVWRSTDDGANWTQFHSSADPAGTNNFNRFYSCVWAGGTFYALETEYVNFAPQLADLWTWDATNGWVEDTTPPGGPTAAFKMIRYRGVVYYLNKVQGTRGSAWLMSARGGNEGVMAEDIVLDGSVFCRLAGSVVACTTTPGDSGRWVTEATAVPADAASLEVVGGTVYVGRDSGLISEVN